MNRRYFLACAALFSLALTRPAFAAPKPPAPQKAALKPQTVIYALGASLFFQDLDGSPPREEKLALPADSQIQYLSGSRDGQTLAFAVEQTIYFYDTASRILAPVTPKNGSKYLYPSISPDGQSVSCRTYSTSATLCILSRDGTVRDLGPATKEATKSRFSADGQTLYFANGPHFFRIAAAGGEAERVVRGNYIENFSINTQNLIIAPVPTSSGVKPALIEASGKMEELEFEPNDFNNPTWSPGGTSVAFSRRARYGGKTNAQGLYIWKNIKIQKEIRKVSDAQSNSESGFVWR